MQCASFIGFVRSGLRSSLAFYGPRATKAWSSRNPHQEGVAMKLKFPVAVPEIPVRDINEAAAYYERNLGFTVDWGGEELGLAGISKGNCRVFLANSDYRKEYGNIGPVLIWLNLESNEEVDDLYRLWSYSKAKLISAPESKPWGLHEFTAADLDGNLFRVFYDFATPERAKNA
jgi:uncharacterized glyoxalase superfamily protein PhnB